MRRKYNDLLAKRAGMLTEAETLLKDGKREDYRSATSTMRSRRSRPSSTSRTASSWNARTILARRRTKPLSAAIP